MYKYINKACVYICSSTFSHLIIQFVFLTICWDGDEVHFVLDQYV
jgi:hypothetical protein